MTGPVVPGFTILRALGEGHSGRVWLAEPDDAALPRRVALKVIRGEMLAEPSLLERLRREGSVGRRLDHPGLLQVFDVLPLDGGAVLVMEAVDGDELESWRPVDDRGRPLSGRSLLDARLEVLARVARALHVAHRAGVVHRDLKPSNILVRRDGSPVVIDFGLAHDDAAESGLTESDAILGTPWYMAPEIVAGRSKLADARTDVYSLGVCAYRFAAGRPPFTGRNRGELWQRILHAEPPRLTSRGADLPAGLEALLLRALEKDPTHRQPHAEALADDLERVLRGESASSSSPYVRRGWREVLRRRLPLLTAVTLVLLAAVWVLGERLGDSRRHTEVQDLLTVGDRSLANGDLVGALSQYDLARARDPDDPRPWLRRAHAHASFDLLAQAAVEITEAEARGWDRGPARGRTPEQLYYVGLMAAAQQDTLLGAQFIEQALEEDPRRDDAYGVLYALQAGMGLTGQAAATLDSWAANLKPRDPRSALVEALRLRDQGRVEEAVATLRAVQDGSPDSTAPTFWRHRYLGAFLIDLGRITEARDELSQAVAMVPRDAVSVCNLGVAAYHSGDLEQAADHARRALELAPRLVFAAILSAQIARDQGDLAAALAATGLSVAPGPGADRLARMRADVLLDIARRAEEQGDALAALVRRDEALAINPRHLQGRLERAYAAWTDEPPRLRDALGDFERCLADWDAWHAGAPHPAEPWTQAYGDTERLHELLIGGFATAGLLGDEARAGAMLERLELALAASPPSTGTRINFAEALALNQVPGLRDCPRALALLASPDVATLVAQDADAGRLAFVIREACR